MSDVHRFDVRELIEREARKLSIDLDEAFIAHPGELGSAREEIVRVFLRRNLPKRLSVSDGFVFDCYGRVSQQIDIVIYDAQLCPVFEVAGGKRYFPSEGVVAVGQVKSKITSKKEYESALFNLHSVKVLDRSGFSQFGETIDPRSSHTDQIFAFVFISGRCLSLEELNRGLFEYLWVHERHLWPNIVFAFNHYLLTYSCEGGLCPNPMDAFALGFVDSASNHELLLWFSRLVAQACVATSVGVFSYHKYLAKAGQWTALAFSDAPVANEIPDHLKSRVKHPSWYKTEPNR